MAMIAVIGSIRSVKGQKDCHEVRIVETGNRTNDETQRKTKGQEC